MDVWFHGILNSYILEYSISTYLCPKIVEFQFLRYPRGTYLQGILLAIKILMVTLNLKSKPMANQTIPHRGAGASLVKYGIPSRIKEEKGKVA